MPSEATQPSPLQHEDEQQDLPELPPMYAVVILNDDKTPMRYVVEMLERLFHFGRRDAIAVMMAIHSRGRGRCGTYCLEVAQTKAEEVVRDARAHAHPLRCVTEKIGDEKA
ncbi:MAG: ATP-dependent Clp protease adaptor ClpS [Gammaproteobacteria bacterium]|nr:ATP-dependent Clp protease adaptor ClpS [Pseudomonadota bacterium]MCH9662100.1 ATP-dependent Clp protease adaptor ClpS [Gammaproteobacteria bacterium]